MAKAQQKSSAQAPAKKQGPARKRRSALERKCIERSDKILFRGMGRAMFKAIVAATEKMRKAKKGGYRQTQKDDAVTAAA